jgi:hypothetical protein
LEENMTKAKEPLLKHVEPADLYEQLDKFREVQNVAGWEQSLADLEAKELCYLKWARPDQVEALRQIVPHLSVVVEWPEAVAKVNKAIEQAETRRTEAARRKLTSVLRHTPTAGHHWAFSLATVSGLFGAMRLKEPARYWRTLDTCRILFREEVSAGCEPAHTPQESVEIARKSLVVAQQHGMID